MEQASSTFFSFLKFSLKPTMSKIFHKYSSNVSSLLSKTEKKQFLTKNLTYWHLDVCVKHLLVSKSIPNFEECPSAGAQPGGAFAPPRKI